MPKSAKQIWLNCNSRKNEDKRLKLLKLITHIFVYKKVIQLEIDLFEKYEKLILRR